MMDNKTVIENIKSISNFIGYDEKSVVVKQMQESLNHAIETLQKVEDGRLVEVVRCKDCIYYNEWGTGYGGCIKDIDENGSTWIVDDNGFCFWGRKEE